MNSTQQNPTPQGSTNDMSSLTYDLTLVIGSVMLVVIITIATCICTRANRQGAAYIIGRRVLNMELGTMEEGLNEETLNTYPKLPYSQIKVSNKEDSSEFLSTTFASTCSICLGDYKDSDTLRLLPDCGHFFHVKCVDPWLRLHSTCPICRKTLHHHHHPRIPVP